MKRILIITLMLFAVSCEPKRRDMPTKQVDAVMTIDTQSKRIRLIDDGGVEVGSLEFEDEVTVWIKRRKQ